MGHGPRIMGHAAALLPWIQIPWTINHAAIPWVLVALDPGTWCTGSGIMGQYPGFWLRLDPGAQDQGSWAMNYEPQHMVLDQLTLTTTYGSLVYSGE